MNMSIQPGFDTAILKQLHGLIPDLEKSLGVAKDRVSVVWSPVTTQDGQAVNLQITDHGVSRSANLTAHDFARDSRAFFRMSGLWDSILAERGRLLADRTREALDEEEEENAPSDNRRNIGPM